mmetsp:Transcript_75901/g.245763  ORF Transcript_75901/g.245763 Transcript_75901/m.245763 type:complete len:318 (-) Transcript_75901:85-1038(-)
MLPNGAPSAPSAPGMVPPMGMTGGGMLMQTGVVPGVPGMAGPGQMQAMLMYQQMMQQQALQQQALQQQMLQSQQVQQQQGMSPSQFTLQAQAYEENAQSRIDTEVQELAHNFKLDERITKDLDVQMKLRKATFEDDMKALWEILDGARNPAGLLRVKIREMEEGIFRQATPDRDIEEMAKKFNLDAQAVAKLAEVLNRREDKKKDIRQVSKHLELSNKPSSLVMLMLKDLRAGHAVKDPEFPAAVGSYAHKRGLKRTGRSRSRERDKKRRASSDSSSSPPRAGATVSRSSGAGPKPGGARGGGGGDSRPMTLLERFG